MKILVTGTAGFVGSHLAEHLTIAGHEVFGIDCLTDYYSVELKQNTIEHLKSKAIDTININLQDANLLEQLTGVEAIFHLAAQPGNSAKIGLQTYVDNNLYATANLLEACLKLKSLKSFIYISTSSVYGHVATQAEDLPAMPISHYGVTKLAAEQLVLAKTRDLGFPACSARLFSVYGPRERPDKLYPLAIKALANDASFPLFEGSEKHQRSFTYIQDAVEGLANILEHWDKAEGEIFNIGCDTAITTGVGIQIVEKIMGKKLTKEILPPRPGDQKSTCANIEKARRLLNYNPKTLPEQGLELMVTWYMDHIHGKVEYK